MSFWREKSDKARSGNSRPAPHAKSLAKSRAARSAERPRTVMLIEYRSGLIGRKYSRIAAPGMTAPGASPLEHAGPRFLMRPGGQTFAPGVAERRRLQVPGFIARADNHKTAGFTRSG